MEPADRRKLLMQWHGVPQPVPKKDRANVVADLLSTLLPKLGLGTRLDEEQVIHCWREIVGDFLATHSKPIGLKQGTLLVQVLQPSVRYELDRTWKPEILRKLRARFGQKTVRDIRFRL